MPLHISTITKQNIWKEEKKVQKKAKVTLKWFSSLCLALSQGLPQRAPALLASPSFSGPTQQDTWASSEFQPGEWSSAPPSIALSSFLRSKFALKFWQVSFHDIRVISAPLPYSAWSQRQSPTQWQSSYLISCWSNSLSDQIKFLKQSFPPIAPSDSKGLHFPLTHLIIHPGKTPTPFPAPECNHCASPFLLLTIFFLSEFHNSI